MAEPGLRVKGLESVKVKLGRFSRELSHANLAFKMAANVRNFIVERSLRGQDVNLQPFKPYSQKPLYVPADFRPAPKGWTRRTKTGFFYEKGYAQLAAATKKGGGKVNLFATGDMFRALQPQKISDNHARVGFTRQKAALKALEVNAERKFMGFKTRRELDALSRLFSFEINRLLGAAGIK